MVVNLNKLQINDKVLLCSGIEKEVLSIHKFELHKIKLYKIRLTDYKSYPQDYIFTKDGIAFIENDDYNIIAIIARPFNNLQKAS